MDPHNRTASESSDSSSYMDYSYQLILEHILTYPASYEIPLRTMYTINSASCAPAMPMQSPRNGAASPSPSPSPTASSFPRDSATQRLTSDLMAQMASLPTQPTSLPPTFITTFLRKCFSADLRYVDFPQALAGLDYLKDLETRRRREVAAALERLDIRRETLGTAEDDLSRRFPGVLEWFKSVEEKERKIEALYTQLYIGLRRWVLINELSLEPFNKHNCVAMLNTLYPPIISSQPTSKLTATILQKQREAFFKYIQGVEKNGPEILDRLMQQGKRATDENGWPAVRQTLDMYLTAVNHVLTEASNIIDMDESAQILETTSKRKGRKVDSGISFTASDRRPSSGSVKSTASTEQAPETLLKEKRSTPHLRGSTLEKIARELRHIGRGRTEVEEMIKPPTPTTSEFSSERPKGLRRIRSLGNLGNLRSANNSSTSIALPTPSDTPAFDVDEMKRARLVYEANAAKTKSIVTTTAVAADNISQHRHSDSLHI
ncbi:hypothetical protein AAFC00_001114 [Neodothiora populina]|uniref:Uncharacterized protein n=1 Tax=Neodothiora populina TaxID=2781224 RepID=A0ABR3PN49_9PEZI